MAQSHLHARVSQGFQRASEYAPQSAQMRISICRCNSRDQITFSDLEYRNNKRKTRRERCLERAGARHKLVNINVLRKQPGFLIRLTDRAENSVNGSDLMLHHVSLEEKIRLLEVLQQTLSSSGFRHIAVFHLRGTLRTDPSCYTVPFCAWANSVHAEPQSEPDGFSSYTYLIRVSLGNVHS